MPSLITLVTTRFTVKHTAAMLDGLAASLARAAAENGPASRARGQAR
jgi:hypothetical protein